MTTLFHEFVAHSLKQFPDVSWLLFAGPNQPWALSDPRLEVVRRYPANDRLKRRLWADHFLVPAAARARGADLLVTVGFVPLRKCLPTVMHVFSLQHLNPDNRMGRARELYRRWIMKRSWPKADVIVTNSRFAAGQILAVYPEFRSRLLTSYEGLQHEQFHPAPAPDEAARLQAELGLAPGYFLWVSNFYPYKQPELLIDAYARLPRHLQKRHPLVMIGGDWEGVLAAARDQVAALGLHEQVRFLGWVDDRWLAPLYRHALAFCLASREETFGRCVIEAMACGAPCVVNDIPIMREVAGDAALLLDFREREALTRALEQLAQDQAARDRLRHAGLANARRFTFEALAAERIAAMRRLLGRARPPAAAASPAARE